MINNKSSNWLLLWAMVVINIALLALAIASDVAWYLLASIVWSLMTMKYYSYITSSETTEESEEAEAVHEQHISV